MKRPERYPAASIEICEVAIVYGTAGDGRTEDNPIRACVQVFRVSDGVQICACDEPGQINRDPAQIFVKRKVDL